MKNFAIILFFLPLISFGQQNLWTTEKVDNSKQSDIKTISKEDVTSEVMRLHDIYDYYYDASGFTIDSFKKMLENYKINSDISLQSLETNEPTAIAYKDNDGRGSMVTVLFINKKNIDAIIFSNHSSSGSIRTWYKGKFAKLINSFWSYGTLERTHYNERTDPNSLYTGKKTIENTGLSLENRRFVTTPQIDNNNDVAGRVAVEITVNREGAIISARAGIRGTTLNDPVLWEKCEKAAMGAQLNQSDKAPSSQRGVIMFVFKVR